MKIQITKSKVYVKDLFEVYDKAGSAALVTNDDMLKAGIIIQVKRTAAETLIDVIHCAKEDSCYYSVFGNRVISEVEISGILKTIYDLFNDFKEDIVTALSTIGDCYLYEGIDIKEPYRYQMLLEAAEWGLE